MKAMVYERYGPPDEVLALREVEAPALQDGHVLVRVHAAAVAIGDWLTMRGLPYFARARYGLGGPRHPVAGFELAGRVEEVGANVTRFRPGDEVFGCGAGALAEYASVAEGSLARKPANLTFEQAAVVPVSGLAALQALRDAGGVRPGQEVLIIGASGGVGTFAVQVAKAFGGTVTGVCSARNVELVGAIGADRVIDYTKGEITSAGHRYDLIVDTAGNRPLSTLRRALTPSGTLVIVGGSGGSWFMGVGRTLRAFMLSPFVSQRLRPFFSRATSEDLTALRELIESGRVTPVIDRTYPLSQTVDAVRHVGGRHTRGKTVVVVQGRSAEASESTVAEDPAAVGR